MRRRTFLALAAAAPFFPSIGCAHKPETPLAHLYGRDWIRGAYEMHGERYLGLERSAEERTEEAYGALAERGIASLDALQTREVPFFIRVDADEDAFAIERNVPERLTFTAGMTDTDRARTQASFEKAREHIHTDYEDIRRLNRALTQLLQQIQRIQSAVDRGREEQFKITRQLTALEEGKLPFELPFQVTPKDYAMVLTMLLERLEDDCARLTRTEASIITVGLTARTTDAGSASLAASLYKVLLAVLTDARSSSPRPAQFPTDEGRQAYLAKGRALYGQLRASAAYKTWEKNEDTRSLEQIGGLLAAFDGVLPFRASSIYRQVLTLYRGEGDYLSYLKTAVGLLPQGDQLAKTLVSAIETTDDARKIARVVLAKGGNPQALLDAAKGRALLNVGSQYALSRIDKQISFYRDKAEVKEMAEALGGTTLLSSVKLAN